MVKAIINISKEANRILNIIKAEHELRTKSEAIEWLAKFYAKSLKKSVEISKRGVPQEHIHKFRMLYG